MHEHGETVYFYKQRVTVTFRWSFVQSATTTCCSSGIAQWYSRQRESSTVRCSWLQVISIKQHPSHSGTTVLSYCSWYHRNFTIHNRHVNYAEILLSVLWCCCLGVKKSIQPIKIWVMRQWCGYLLELSANSLHMVQLVPLPPHHLCFSKIQNDLS